MSQRRASTPQTTSPQRSEKESLSPQYSPFHRINDTPPSAPGKHGVRDQMMGCDCAAEPPLDHISPISSTGGRGSPAAHRGSTTSVGSEGLAVRSMNVTPLAAWRRTLVAYRRLYRAEGGPRVYIPIKIQLDNRSICNRSINLRLVDRTSHEFSDVNFLTRLDKRTAACKMTKIKRRD